MVMYTSCQLESAIFDTAVDSSREMQTSVQQLDKEKSEQLLLVHQALQGSHEAFGRIVTLYSTVMMRTATMIIGDQDIAEDMVQDAFIQAWHHLADLRQAGALRPWLMRIVFNQCVSFKRRLARSTACMRQMLADQETSLVAGVADAHKGCIERGWDLAQAIENLPLKQRVAIVLHYYEGMTLPEMAQELHISENTLKKRIQAALTNLRRLLYVSSDYEERGTTDEAKVCLLSIA